MNRTHATPSTTPVLFIQGAGAGTHDDWDDRLVDSLERRLGQGYTLLYPEMPNEADPKFRTWSAAIAREIDGIDTKAILVGHSIGGAILIHTLARNPQLLQNVTAVCLIAAPYLGDDGWSTDEIEINPDWADALSGANVYLYQGDADDTTPSEHVGLYAKAIPHADVRRLSGRDHQLNDDLSEVAQDIMGLNRT